jgi:hypothetical protein
MSSANGLHTKQRGSAAASRLLPSTLICSNRTARSQVSSPLKTSASVGVVELDDDAAGRQLRVVDAAVHPPCERDRVDVVGAEILVEPVHGPTPQGNHDVLEILAGGGQLVFVAATGPRRPCGDHPLAFEVLQPLHEQRS